ncbi:MAG: HEAT repeat domain-containing protein [Candidatus Zixiibacteriota bacterium]|nr:MAG: HEAT repeat domain-containing protein [candidate division Zixibacteria bacterium]
MKEHTYAESDLNTNLNELVHEVLRELFLASKKTSVYSCEHPLAGKAIGRAFVLMERVFKFKRYFNLHISDGHLYALNIRTRPSIFVDQIMDYMQILDLNDILFESGITVNQLSLFISRFVKRLPATDYSNLMTSYIEEHKLEAILVNSRIGMSFFENSPRLRGDLAGDFSVRAIVSQIIGEDFEKLACLLNDEKLEFKEYFSKYNHDYYPELITFLIPEKIAAVDAEDIVRLLQNRVSEVVGTEGQTSVESLLEKFKDLIAALNYHSEREAIIDRITAMLAEMGTDRDVYSQMLPQTSAIKIESSEKIDQFLYSTFNQALPGYDLNDFRDLFSRLLRTGQQGKARSIVNILMNHLAGPDVDLRQKALLLFRMMFSVYSKTTSAFLVEYLVSKVSEYLLEEKETFEFSDLIWELAQVTLAEKDYHHLSSMCDVLLKKRTLAAGIRSYDSVAVKKAIEEFNRREVIDQLVQDLIGGTHSDVQYIKNVLVTIGSEEAALALADIISHKSRQVRQYVLKILSEMGKASLIVFSEALKDNKYFDREANKRELPDENWYFVRNSIFVLGSLKDAEACRALRVRINDDDTRVRRSIIQALEKIGGEQAADLLLVLATDSDREIRQAAIIALGYIGSQDIVPELIDLVDRFPSEVATIITTMGMLGGNEARQFLTNLLKDRPLQSKLTSSRSSRDDLKLATIKALGRIGDRESLEEIQNFNDSLSASQKILFGASKLNKAAEDILNRRKN